MHTEIANLDQVLGLVLFGGFLSSIGSAIGSVFGSLSSALGSFASSGAGQFLKMATPFFGSAASYMGASELRDATEDLYEDQKAWQTYMSNTSYQRAMADMRAAGLNPILAGKLGGASTPGLQMPQLSSLTQDAVNSAFTGMSTVSNVGLQESQAKLTEQQVDKVREEAIKISQDYHLSQAQTDAVRVGIKKAYEEINKIRAETNYREALTAIPEVVAELIGALRDYVGLKSEKDIYQRIVDFFEVQIRQGDTSESGESQPFIQWNKTRQLQ